MTMGKNSSTKTINPGLIWVPYIIENHITTISDHGFTPSHTLTSRYSQSIKISKAETRKDKIKDVLSMDLS